MVAAWSFHGSKNGVLTGLRDGRRDRGQLVVGVLVEAGVGGDDEVGFQRGDLVDLDAVGEAEDRRLGAAEFGQRPRPHAERLGRPTNR